jgi:acyl-[acyl-carrier-protein]-phospholipid O-acyltransferase/long-chain-fatty-acid--[acyl-carrier-protein] ligase
MEWYYILAAVVAYLGVYTLLAWISPQILRPFWWLLVHSLHKFHVYGRDRVPKTGPVLIVANHVSYIDWMIFWLATPRKLTFVLWAGYKQYPVLRFFFSFVKRRTIFVENRRSSPHALAEALQKVADSLAGGRAVLVFPEGRHTRNGQMMPFQRGIEWVVKKAGVPVTVVPACIWNMWGGPFTWKGGRIFWKKPEELRRRVAIQFGHPLPGETPVAEIRAAVVECQAECARNQSEFVIPVHAGFVRHAARIRNFRRVAFVDASGGSDRTLTWPKALVGAWCLAKWLKPRLPESERNVGVWLPTGIGGAFANIALAFLRRTSVNLNYTAGTAPVRAAAKAAEIRTVITARKFLARMPLDLPDDVKLIHLEDALAGIPGWWKLLRMLAVLALPGWFLDRVVLRCRRFGWDDLITIIFSSGSTGDPKGVMLSLRNVSANADGFQKGVNFESYDRMLCTLPIFHSFGFTVCLWAPASIGMMSVCYPDPRAAKEVGELCRRWRCSIVLGTATFLRFYLRRCDPEDFKAARFLICGAEKLPVSLQDEFEQKFGVRPLEGYGCTETAPVVSTNLPDVTHHGIRQIANTPGTTGQPIPGVVVRAFDDKTGLPLPTGTEGVLCVRGPNVMEGYLRDPVRTAQAIRDGWYWTGDFGRVEPEGFIRITGRLSRFAKIAGEMVPLERLEEEIHELLATAGERAVAIVAMPDPKRGERIVVLHTAECRANLAGAFEGLKAKGLPNLWIPDLRDCHPVESFPVLGSGKLDLRGLNELAQRIVSPLP